MNVVKWLIYQNSGGGGRSYLIFINKNKIKYSNYEASFNLLDTQLIHQVIANNIIIIQNLVSILRPFIRYKF